MHNFIDTSRGHADVFCQAVLAEPHRIQEFLEQDLAGVNRSVCLPGHGCVLSVVIRDFHIVGIAPAPPEADAPLIVDSDAVLSGTISR
jgi:hypothetical protein